MSLRTTRIVRRGAQKVRTGPWRGDPRTAHLSPLTESLPLSEDFVRHCLEDLRVAGYEAVVTSALTPSEQEAFLDLGFAVEQELHLLAHDLHGLPEPVGPPGFRFRRARPADMASVVEVDASAFDRFWTMDATGLGEAVEATPRARFRVAVQGSGVAGYAITGRSGHRGYLQRLAVGPDHRGVGVGRALVVDGLRWLRRWGAERCLVNTQFGNQRALDLYTSLGFRLEPSGLAVLGRRLTP